MIESANVSQRFLGEDAEMSRRKLVVNILLVSAVVMLGVAFYCNHPCPEGIGNPWRYVLFCAAKEFITDLAYLQHKVFSQQYVYAYRNLMDLFTSPHPSEVPGSNIRSSVTDMAGVAVRLYEPIVSKPGLQPALIFIHGGGFCIGNTELYDALVRPIAEELDTVVISIEYRLGPEAIHPAAFEDCFNVTRWFLLHAGDYNVDSRRVGISGDSAGGSLAAAVSQYIHDDPDVPDLKFQALIYPIVQLIDVNTPSMETHKAIFGANSGLVTWWEAASFLSLYLLGEEDKELIDAFLDSNLSLEIFWHESIHAKYVNHSLIPDHIAKNDIFSKKPLHDGNRTVWEHVGDEFLDPRLCPLMREDFSGLPPAFIATCEFDGMRDNGIYYHSKLKDFGVKTEWKHYKGGFHGVFGPTWPFTFDVGQVMIKDFIHYVKNNW